MRLHSCSHHGHRALPGNFRRKRSGGRVTARLAHRARRGAGRMGKQPLPTSFFGPGDFPGEARLPGDITAGQRSTHAQPPCRGETEAVWAQWSAAGEAWPPEASLRVRCLAV